MSKIKQLTGTITKVVDLSPTAKELTIRPDDSLPFVAGAFVNLFVDHNGETIRRAFSVSSSDTNETEFTLAIRLTPEGKLTPLFWQEDFTDKTIKLMGPLGLNTAEKMQSRKVYLFGFGIGAGVVKSLAEHMKNRQDLESLTIVTGSRNTDDILYQKYFDKLSQNDSRITTKYVVSDKQQTIYPIGYIQHHLTGYDFNGADVYICGQTVACTDLESTIKNSKPKNCHFFVEDFH